MPHCTACNTFFEDVREIGGGYRELCGTCHSVSVEACYTMVEPEDRPEDPPLGSYDELRCWLDAVRKHDFGIGLGLMDERDRVAFLRQRAHHVFNESRLAGKTCAAAIEDALGTAKFRGDQTNVTS